MYIHNLQDILGYYSFDKCSAKLIIPEIRLAVNTTSEMKLSSEDEKKKIWDHIDHNSYLTSSQLLE